MDPNQPDSNPDARLFELVNDHDHEDSSRGNVSDRLENASQRMETQSGEQASMQHSEDRIERAGQREEKPTYFVHPLLSHTSHHGQSKAEIAPTNIGFANQIGEPQHDQDESRSGDLRLITKRQLSDMASDIRELSKRLGRIRLLLAIQNVFLLTKAYDEKLITFTRIICQWLLQQRNSSGLPYTIWVEDTLKGSKLFDAEGLTQMDPANRDRIKYWNYELCKTDPDLFEMIITLGGDGTILYASWLFQRIIPPVMSFALGSLGFLTKFDFENHQNTLKHALTAGVTISLRLRFEGTIMRARKREGLDNSGKKDLIGELTGKDRKVDATHVSEGTHNILNDIVLDRGPHPTMSTVEVFGDSEHFTTVQADGVCVATPTGSTAYNLAAGGSLCHPDNPVILLTAIAPHTLSFRPIILPDTMVLELGVPYDARASCWASFDGKERCELKPGDFITITASRFPFPTILPFDRKKEDWIDSISRKLNWNDRKRQKAFDNV